MKHIKCSNCYYNDDLYTCIKCKYFYKKTNKKLKDLYKKEDKIFYEEEE